MIVDIVFYTMATALICSALMVALNAHPVRSVLALIGCFVWTAVLWLLLDAEFLSLALIFVYVGAVMALFLFIVFMLNVHRLPKALSLAKRVGYTLMVILGLGVVMIKLGWRDVHVGMTQPIQHSVSSLSNTQEIGQALYLDHWLEFEVVGLILLSAMIAAIALVLKKSDHKVHHQQISDQLSADAKKRVTWMDRS